MSPKFYLDKEDLYKIMKVFGWTVASAAVVFLLNLMQVVQVPSSYIWLMPLINTALVAIQRWIADNSQ